MIENRFSWAAAVYPPISIWKIYLNEFGLLVDLNLLKSENTGLSVDAKRKFKLIGGRKRQFYRVILMVSHEGLFSATAGFPKLFSKLKLFPPELFRSA